MNFKLFQIPSPPPLHKNFIDANISKIQNVTYLELNSDRHGDLFFSSCLVTAVLSNSQIIVYYFISFLPYTF
jgi:hypothetical protein